MNNGLLFEKLKDLKQKECFLSLLNKNDIFTINQDKFKDMIFIYEDIKNGLVVARQIIYYDSLENLLSNETYNLLSSIIVETDVAEERINTFKTEYIFRKSYIGKLDIIFNDNLFEDMNIFLEYLCEKDLNLTDLIINFKLKNISIQTEIKMTKNPNILFNISDIQNQKLKESFNFYNNKKLSDFKHILNKNLQFRVQHLIKDIVSFRKLPVLEKIY